VAKGKSTDSKEKIEDVFQQGNNQLCHILLRGLEQGMEIEH
jgi:hypothetical protein